MSTERRGFATLPGSVMCSADFLGYDYIQMLSRLREDDGAIL
jgi:hypothetical protein